METKRFSKNDAGFRCCHCGQTVPPLGYTSRNHCPHCLWSLHVDVMPGDRANACGGAMRPIGAVPDTRRGFILIHRCEVCGAVVRNRAALKAPSQPDNLELIIRLTVHPV